MSSRLLSSRLLQFAVSAAFGATLFSPSAALAEYPDQPVRMIVPFGTGGGTDIQARLLTDRMRQSTGQQFLVDNRSGAGGLIGAQAVTEAAPDGYTLLFTTASLAVNVPLLDNKMKFSATKDLAPITWVSSSPLVLVVHPSVPAKSLREFLQIAKKQPGVLNGGVTNTGSTSHLSAEMLKQLGGLDFVIVPFRGGGPASIGVASGEVDFLFTAATAAMPHIKTGRVRPLAVTTAKKASVFPDLPTMNSVYPGFESDNWYAMFFPKGVSKDKIMKLHSEVAKALKDKVVADFYKREGLDAVASSPEELAALLDQEIKKYTIVIKKGNIKP